MPGTLQATDPRIDWRDLTAADVDFVRFMIPSFMNGALPYGYHDTSAYTAWGGMVSQAIQRGEIAIGAVVNGGSLAGVLVARPSPKVEGLVVEALVALDAWGLHDKLLAVGRELAQQRGQQLLLRSVIPEQVAYEAA